MQREYGRFKSHGLDRPIRSALIIFHYLKYARATKASQHLGRLMAITALCFTQGEAENATHWARQAQ